MSRLVFFLMVVAPALAICLALLGLETLPLNFMGYFLLLLGTGYLVGGVLYYFDHSETYGNLTRADEASDRFPWLILPGFLSASFAPPLELLYGAELLPRLIWMQIAGLVLVLLGLTLLVWAQVLRRGLSHGLLNGPGDHRLVQGGPYRFIRHPGDASIVLLALGISIGYSSVIGLVAIPLLLLPGLAYRMHVEERRLLEAFGQEYRAYCRTTKMLVPGIW